MAARQYPTPLMQSHSLRGGGWLARKLPVFIQWPSLNIPATDVKSLTGGRRMAVARKPVRAPPLPPPVAMPELTKSLSDGRRSISPLVM
jgi:hypothetical protein